MTYSPQPIDTGQVALSAELLKMTELLAKNTHEVWALRRISQGWRYGSSSNDVRKEHPCLIPYEDLPESEKEYDRFTAIETLKLISLMGFSIVKET